MMVTILNNLEVRAVAAGGEWVLVRTHIGLIAACHSSGAVKRANVETQHLRMRWKLDGKVVTRAFLWRKLNT